MPESVKSRGHTVSRPSELEHDPPSPISEVSIPTLRSELAQVIEVFTMLSPELHQVTCLVIWRFSNFGGGGKPFGRSAKLSG